MVCLCHGVGDRRVRREIEHGATTIEQIADRCRAGSCCYGCHPTLDALLDIAQENGRARPDVPFAVMPATLLAMVIAGTPEVGTPSAAV